MRSMFALYALRFGAWLLAKSAAGAVVLTVDVYSRKEELGGIDAELGDFGDIYTLTRSYGK